MRNLTACPEWTLPIRVILKHGSDQDGSYTSRVLESSRYQFHALTEHRIPAQGANPGTPPGKETFILEERRIVAEI